MLVLSRKVGEKVRIGSDIELVVVAVQGDMVRLGISAPKGVPIHRQEIYAAILAENMAAAAVSVGDLVGALGNFPYPPKVPSANVDNKVECSARDEQQTARKP